MPYPTPPGPRIAYDDPGIASLFLDRSIIARDTKNDNIWVDARLDGVKAMNAGEGFGVGTTHDPTANSSSSTPPPFNAIWDAANTDACVMNLVFQEPYTIKGIEMVVAYYATSNEPRSRIANVKMFSVPDGKDPFGIEVTSHGVLATPTYIHLVTLLPATPPPSYPESIMTEFPLNLGQGGGISWHTLKLDSPRTVQPLDIVDTRALRFIWSAGRTSFPGGSGPTWQLIKLCLYGYPTDPTRLGFVAPTSSTPLAYEDLTFGDTALGSSKDLTFRVKNFSETKTANNVVLSAENNPGYPSPTPASQLLFSSDGISWSSTFTLPSNLPPGATSFIMYVRKVTPTNSSQGQKHPRIRADVGSWT